MRLYNFVIHAIFAGLFLTASIQAETFTVDRTDNANVSSCTAAANDCTLRGAITAANAAATDDVIDFDPAVFNTDTTIALSAGNLLPNIANNGTLTINAPTANRVTVSGSNAVRVFTINTGVTFEVNNLTVANGLVGGAAGGGILNNGTLTMTNCTLDNNQSGQNGGAIANFGTIMMMNCTLSNNRAGSGAGIVNFASGGNSITLNNTTISGNVAVGSGGGIATTGITTTLNNSTVSGNSANSGGGINSGTGSTLILNSTTISGNSATTIGGGLYSINSGTATLNNSIIANSTSGGDCRTAAGGNVSATYSLIEDNLTCVNLTNSNNLTGDPNLGPLADNGGSTQTHALLPGSIAIDTGNSALTTDQRGSTRPVDDSNSANGSGNLADIGAFEVQAPTAAGVSISGRVSNGRRGVSRAIVHLTDQNGNVATATTNMFGYFQFADIEVGQSLVVNVFHRTFQFTPQVVTVNDAISDLSFTPQVRQTKQRSR